MLPKKRSLNFSLHKQDNPFYKENSLLLPVGARGSSLQNTEFIGHIENLEEYAINHGKIMENNFM